MPVQPTAAELAKHRLVVAKLRAELFRDQTPASLFIVPASEAIVPPYIDGRISQGRNVSYGGLSYRVKSERPGHWYELSIEHRTGDEFVIFLGVRNGGSMGYTSFAMQRHFHELADAVRYAIEEERKVGSRIISSSTDQPSNCPPPFSA